MLSEKKTKIIKWIGYPAFAMVCLMLSLVWTFPFNQLKGKISKQLEDNYDIRVEMDLLSSSLPLGVKASNITFFPKTEETSSGFLPLNLASLEINVGLFALVTGNLNVALDAEVFGGEISGDFQIDQAANRYVIDLTADELAFDKIGFLKQQYKELPFKGKANLRSEMDLHFNKIADSSGYLTLDIDNAVVGPGRYGIDVPGIRLGKLTSRFTIEKGKLEVTTFEQREGDILSDMMGNISLNKNIGNSRLNLDYRFKIQDGLKNTLEQDPLAKTALSQLDKSKGSDEYYYQTIRGTLGHPRPVNGKASQVKFENRDNKAKGVKSKTRSKRRSKPKAKKTSKRSSRSKAAKSASSRARKGTSSNKAVSPKSPGKTTRSSKAKPSSASSRRSNYPRTTRSADRKNNLQDTQEAEELEEDDEEVEEDETEDEEEEEDEEVEEDEEEVEEDTAAEEDDEQKEPSEESGEENTTEN